jgi:hypothetical protein
MLNGEWRMVAHLKANASRAYAVELRQAESNYHDYLTHIVSSLVDN